MSSNNEHTVEFHKPHIRPKPYILKNHRKLHPPSWFLSNYPYIPSTPLPVDFSQKKPIHLIQFILIWMVLELSELWPIGFQILFAHPLTSTVQEWQRRPNGLYKYCSNEDIYCTVTEPV